MRKPILCLDFDGVIHSYSSGWQGAGVCNDPPVAGTLAFLEEAAKHYRLAIYSSRSKSISGRRAMKRYMREHFESYLAFSPQHDRDTLYEYLEWPWFKPSAFITIDDRALTFTGNWEDFTPRALADFKPWNKHPAQAMSAGTAETEGLRAKPASAVPQACAPTSPEPQP